MTVKFVKVLRECPHNLEVAAGGKPVGGGGLIYDYNVIDGGLHVATWQKQIYRREYVLVDTAKEPVRYKSSGDWWSRVTVTLKVEFERVYLQHKKDVPTLLDIQKRDEDRAAKQRKVKLDNLASSHSLELLSALEDMMLLVAPVYYDSKPYNNAKTLLKLVKDEA